MLDPSTPRFRLPEARGGQGNFRRFAALIWSLGVALVAVLLIFWPPIEAMGPVAGWLMTAAGFGAAVAALLYGLAHPERVGLGNVLVASYLAVLGLALLQWAAGGREAPYHEILLLPVLANALGHPPRRFLPLLALIWLADLAPIAYDDAADQAVGDTLVELVLWSGLGVFCLSLIQRLGRRQVDTERLAMADSLTGLANRRAFESQAAAVLRRHGPVALAVGDLDRFKSINDQHGHLAGDSCLIGVAAALRRAARAHDTVFRWGGDEFAVLLVGAAREEAAKACARLEATVARSVSQPDGDPVTITFGLALHTRGMSLQDLVAAADSSLLARKAARGSRR